MAIRKRGETWVIDYYTPNGKRIVKGGFKTRKAAKLEEAARLEAIDKGMYYEKAKAYPATLEELVAKYKENYRDQASYETAKKYWLENFKDYFGKGRLLTAIRYADLVGYRNHLKRKPTPGGIRSIAARNREIACLRHLFSEALEWEMVKENPFDKGKSLLQKEDNERLRYLEESEIERLLAECPKHLRHIVICAINTGMDRGELLNLKWKQIRNEHIYLPKYKTRPKRQVPINDDLKQLFSEIRKDQELRSEYVLPMPQVRTS
jgi:integrase